MMGHTQQASSQSVRTLVLGMGATGLSVARHLARTGQNARFADARPDVDTREIRALLPDADIEVGGLDNVSLDGVEHVIASPGIPPHEPLLQRAAANNLRILSDIDLFADAATAPIVAVTGSNGKSTTVSLVAHLCDVAGTSAYAGGNLGTPALDLLTLPEPAYYVLELSSFQLARTETLDTLCACLLNLSPDHLDWHGDFEAYRDAKYRIFRRCEYAVVNADEPPPTGVLDPAATVVGFTLDAPAGTQFGLIDDEGRESLAFGSSPLLPAADCGIRGRHNLANALAALAIGSVIDLPMTAMLDGLASFEGLAHRHQLVDRIDGVEWINDSKATNTASALASVCAVTGPVILLAGGRGKGQDLEAFAAALPNRIRQCLVFGEHREQFERALEQAGHRVDVVDTLFDAVTAAAAIAEAGDTVLLAPAAASHDQFANYMARGDAFANAVRERRS